MERKFWLVQVEGFSNGFLMEEDVSWEYEEGEATVAPCPNPSGKQLANWMDNRAQDSKCRPQNEVHTEFYDFLIERGFEEAVVTRIFQEWAENHDFFHKKGWKY